MIGRLLARLLGRAWAHLRRERTLLRLGGLALALALGVAFLPWLFPASIFRPISRTFAGPVTIGLFGLAAGALGALALRQEVARNGDGDRDGNGGSDWGEDETAGRGRDEFPDLWVPRPVPERAHYDEHRTAGDAVDSVFTTDASDPDALQSRRETARGRIRETAITVVAAAENCDPETAAGRIRDGTWTDDPRAAAFLGGAKFAPLRIRIRDWASGEQFERWATHAVAEIEAVNDEKAAAAANEKTAAAAAGEGRR
jgi:hypothetical protein